MRVLVVGGAGYIGSHMLKTLILNGCDAVAYDNLSTGHRDALLYGEFVHADLADRDILRYTLRNERFDGVIHFASSIEVAESLFSPRKYYNNNVVNTLSLINEMIDAGVNNLIFSSSAAVYGSPANVPVKESAPMQPLSVYGRTKAMIESILIDYREAYGFASTSLRYFNAAGADFDGELGERHEPETHLIPLVIQAALGLKANVKIFGSDYDTLDGTCVRDYIHVSDLCTAHVTALRSLQDGSKGSVFNLANGTGFSVRQIVDAVSEISGKTISVIQAPRRRGDPSMLVACANKAKRQLGWNPLHTELNEIIGSAWRFYSERLDQVK